MVAPVNLNELMLELYNEAKKEFEVQPVGLFCERLIPSPTALIGKNIKEKREIICQAFESLGIRMEPNPDTVHTDYNGFERLRYPCPGIIVYRFTHSISLEVFLSKKKLN